MKKFLVILALVSACLSNSYAQEQEPVIIELPEAAVSGVSSYCMEVRATNFTNLIGIQFALEWDSGLRFESLTDVHPQLGELIIDRDYAIVGQQLRIVIATDNQEMAIGSAEMLFRVCFSATPDNDNARIFFSDNFTGEAVKADTYESIPVIGNTSNVQFDRPKLVIEDVATFAGEEVCLPVVTESIDSLYSIDLTLDWDDDLLAYQRIEFGDSNMDTSLFQPTVELSNSSLQVNWQNSDLENLILPFTATLFAVCYEAIAEETTAAFVRFAENSTVQKWEEETANTIPAILDDGIVEIFFIDSTAAVVAIGDTLVATGESFCIPMTSTNIEQLTGLQFAIEWDPEVLSFEELKLDNSPFGSDFSFFNTTENTLSFAWFEPGGQNIQLSNVQPLMDFCFTASGNFTTDTEVGFTNDVFFEAIRNDQDTTALTDVELKNGVVTVFGAPRGVLPGDTNLDSEASHYDLLNIGLGFGITGPVRPNASIDFVAQEAEDWGTKTPNTNVDYKHVDTNGDGVINELDVEAIEQNWFSFPTLIQSEVTEDGVPFFVESDTIELAVENVLPIILGTAEETVNGIYGIAFSIYYESENMVDEKFSISADSSWLGTLGENLLLVQRHFPEENRIDVALTRTDQQFVSGFGKICALTIVMEDVILFSESPTITFSIDHFMMLEEAGNALKVSSKSSIAEVMVKTTGNDDITEEIITAVYPNPTSGKLFVKAPIAISKIVLKDAFAKTVKIIFDPQADIDLSGFPPGLYYLELQTNKGIHHHSIIIE